MSYGQPSYHGPGPMTDPNQQFYSEPEPIQHCSDSESDLPPRQRRLPHPQEDAGRETQSRFGEGYNAPPLSQYGFEPMPRRQESYEWRPQSQSEQQHGANPFSNLPSNVSQSGLS